MHRYTFTGKSAVLNMSGGLLFYPGTISLNNRCSFCSMLAREFIYGLRDNNEQGPTLTGRHVYTIQRSDLLKTRDSHFFLFGTWTYFSIISPCLDEAKVSTVNTNLIKFVDAQHLRKNIN